MEKKKVIKTFSTEFKKEKVGLIEQGKLTVLDLSRIYEVSPPAVYKWIRKYGKQPKTERVVLEKISESSKNIELMKKIAELERIIGKQQLQIIYKESVIECASELLGEDIEKKYNSQQ
jgi:transposase-like protein